MASGRTTPYHHYSPRTSSGCTIFSSNIQESHLPLEECYPNSQDSGYGEDLLSSSSKLPHRRNSSGYESTEDDFNELIDVDTEVDSTIPEVKHSHSGKRTSCSEKNSSVFAIIRKRSKLPDDHSPAPVKRVRKCIGYQEASLIAVNRAQRSQQQQQQRGISEIQSNDSIRSAIHRSTTSEDLTGDFSKTCVLPLAIGKHEDLKSISCETLAKLIRGDFHDKVREFKIVDCRYPYEFEGGHIDGAINLYTQSMIEDVLLGPLPTDSPTIEPDTEDNKRSIIIFHCEFSLERGPNLARFLRSVDRQRNEEHYPALNYPEIYLLHGGYQTFFKEEIGFCSPQAYCPMLHPEHEADLRQFRKMSKSNKVQKKRRINVGTARANLKRLDF